MQEFRLPGPLVLLPPIGADAELLRPQRRAFGDQLITPDHWTPAQEHQSIERYAQRMLETLSIPTDGRPVFIGGVSSGGALALEMAGVMDPQPAGVFLLGSLRTAHAMPLRIQIGEHLQHWTPTKTFRKLMPTGALVFAQVDGLDDSKTGLLRAVARRGDAELIQWAGVALFDWDRDGRFPPGYPPIHQIHGKRDWVLPLRLNPQVDTVVGDGKHLIHLTHPQTVNRYIMQRAWASTDAPATLPGPRRVAPGTPAWTG